ncbi:hypothetical protein Tco_0682068 [Tanacetum coccineum]|uniref:Reverse transcriptase domain-containing protein n=1 Tax=Tanacetum coccineum TaxID=301880 RepID=A0ABQ4XQ60_9ASTR
MRTRNSNFPNNSPVNILRRQNRGRAPNVVEPELRTIVEVTPMAERTMEEILRAPTEGYGEAIVLPEINVDHFEIKTNLLQLVQASSEAWERFKEILRVCPYHGFTELTQADTFYNGLNENDQDSLNIVAGRNLLSNTTREALNIIENKSKVRYSRNKLNVSRMNTTSRESVSKTDEIVDKLADQLSTLVEIVSKKVVTPAPVKAVEEICVTCSGPHAWYNCPNTDNNQSSVCAATGTYNQVNPPNRVSNQMAPPGFAPVQNNGQNSDRETEETTDKEQTNFQGSTAHILPPVNPIPILEPDFLKTLPKPNIPYPSRRNDQKSRDKALNQMEKIFKIFQDLHFDISFADALLLMPIFAPMIRVLLMNKEKLLELAKIPLNENCSAMLLKKLPEKLGDPCKFLILCDFPGMDGCDSLLEDFADELALLDPFPPGNKDVDVEAHLREIKLLLNRDPSTNFSPTIMIDPNPKKFTDEPALAWLPPPGDDDDDESFFKEDVQKENFRIYSTPLFEFDDNFNSSSVNPLFNEMVEDVESENSNVSYFDESVLLHTPFFNEDECFDP